MCDVTGIFLLLLSGFFISCLIICRWIYAHIIYYISKTNTPTIVYNCYEVILIFERIQTFLVTLKAFVIKIKPSAKFKSNRLHICFLSVTQSHRLCGPRPASNLMIAHLWNALNRCRRNKLSESMFSMFCYTELC